jgi:hypothetical protein
MSSASLSLANLLHVPPPPPTLGELGLQALEIGDDVDAVDAAIGPEI